MEASMRHFLCAMVALSGLLLSVSLSTAALGAGINPYGVTILTSDIPGLGTNPTDPSLQNPWGMGFSTTSPFWAGNQASGTTTLYGSPNGAANTTVGPVTIPGGGGTTSGSPGPTGVVSNGANANGDGVTGTGFTIIGQATPAAASFIFDNLNGQISAWNGGIGNKGTAIVEVTTPGASYTGLAIANNGTQDLLYAADNAAGSGHSKIAVFGQATGTSPWASVTLTGNFVDPNLPANTAPYNIQLLNGQLYVTYQTGAFAVFDLNGNFIRDKVDSTDLKSPWGLALAPAGFGQFGGDLLVANKTGGLINAFDPTTNTFNFLGSLTGPTGSAIQIPGIWAIAFRAASSNFDANTLYFDAGVNGTGGNFFSDGEFGSITAIPEPSSAILLGLGLIVLCGCSYWQVRRRRFQARPALAAGVALR
jgi:uncharacterized protein (TIGR03118 family)